MRHVILVSTLCLIGVAACGRGSESRMTAPTSGNVAYEATTPMDRAVAQTSEAFAYNHALWLTMADERVEPRFSRARDRCLQDAALNCKLVSASVNSGGSTPYDISRAQLDLMLPGDKVDQFEKALTEPLSGEEPDDVKIESRSTTAQNVEQQAGDLDQQIAQRTAYRDRLAELANRPNLTAPELIQIAEELSKVQSALDQLLAQKRDVTERIAKQRLTITLTGRVASDPVRPITQVFENALDLFIESAAEALSFVIQVVPWLPIIGAAIALIGWLWRRIRRRPKAA